jgi:hypothetical protein
MKPSGRCESATPLGRCLLSGRDPELHPVGPAPPVAQNGVIWQQWLVWLHLLCSFTDISQSLLV